MTVISAIIPAYNEQETIGRVIDEFRTHPHIDEVIVVTDGCTDRTAEVARARSVLAVELMHNVGKGDAMAKAVERAKGDIILFADADLVGLNHDMISTLIKRITKDGYDMFTLIRDRSTETFQLHLPSSYAVGGERALCREVFEQVPANDRKGFQIKLAMNYYAEERGMRIGHELAPGLMQVSKEKKFGIVEGTYRRIIMTAQCMKALWKLHGANQLPEVQA